MTTEVVCILALLAIIFALAATVGYQAHRLKAAQRRYRVAELAIAMIRALHPDVRRAGGGLRVGRKVGRVARRADGR